MLFMNTWEIDEAVQRHRNDPVLSKATKLLADLRDLADSVSDGWCYWTAPCRAARQLQEIIQTASKGLGAKKPTAAELKKAITPIKAFLTREAKQLQGKTVELPVIGG